MLISRFDLMKLIAYFIVLLSLFNKIKCNSQYHNEFTHEWAVKVSDPYKADLIALETGFENRGLVNFIPLNCDYFKF